MDGLDLRDAYLVRVYVTACLCRWNELPDIAKAFLDEAGGTVAELRGCLRHMIM